MSAQKMYKPRGQSHLQQALRKDLHDLCQPLAVLQCQLELGQMIGDPHALSGAVAGGLTEMERILHCVSTMRQRLSSAAADQEG